MEDLPPAPVLAALSPPPPPLASVSVPLAQALGLPHLPAHFPYLLGSFIACLLIQLLLSPLLSPLLFPRHYPSRLSAKSRFSWNVRAVSETHALLIVPVAIRYLLRPPASLALDPLFGYDARFARWAAVSTGYFVWDSIMSAVEWLKYEGGFGFVVHGVGCVAVFGNGFRPYAMGFGAMFLTWETSTIFLNVHWALDKLSMTGSTLQLANGVALLTSFFVSRNVVGVYQSYKFQRAIWAYARLGKGVEMAIVYGATNVALNCLNVVWFTQMIAALRKRFKPKPPRGAKLKKTRRESIADEWEDRLAEMDRRNPVPWTSGEETDVAVNGLKEE